MTAVKLEDARRVISAAEKYRNAKSNMKPDRSSSGYAARASKKDPGVEVGIETWVETAHYNEHPSCSNTTFVHFI